MATQNQKQDEKDAKQDVAAQSPDVQAASRAGVSEGEVHALRDDSGLNRVAGHEANVKAWEASEQGKAFLKGEKDRNKEAEAGAKKAHEGLDKDGVSPAVKEYTETVGE